MHSWKRNRRPITERHPDWNLSAISQNVMMDMEIVSSCHGTEGSCSWYPWRSGGYHPRRKNYEIAIETALGGSIQNIVTDNEQTAKQMIEFLKKNRYGRATFLPLNSISSRGEFNQRGALNEPGAIGLASGW